MTNSTTTTAATATTTARRPCPLPTVGVPCGAIPRGHYAAHVAERGHVRGVLSGAEIKGKASEYGGWYARQRDHVTAALAPFGVRSALVLVGARDILGRYAPRHVRCWVDQSGARVRVVLTDGPVQP